MTRQQRVEAALEQAPAANGQGYARANCPFCDERVGKRDRTRCLSIHVQTGFYGCFRCGIKGKMRGPQYLEVEDLRDAETPAIAPHQAIAPPDSYAPLWREPYSIDRDYAPARRYLIDRGLTRATAAECQIGACLSGRYAGRVIVPVLDVERETWLGFVARDYTGQAERKYLYPSGMVRNLWNHRALLQKTTEPVYVVEGVFDAIAHYPHAVAVLGKPTNEQFSALAAACRPVVVVLDGDAWEEGWALAMRLRVDGAEAGAVRLPPKIDPDEVDPYWLWEEARASLGKIPA
jgi:hypothetical protein